MAHVVLSSVGLACVWWWDGGIEDLWETLVGRAPALSALENHREGFAKFRRDPLTHAFGVDGPRGSAVVVAMFPDGDTMHLVKDIMQPLDHVSERGITLSTATQGTIDSRAADVLESGSIVQLTELPLRGQGAATDFTVFPPWLRRDLTAWTQVSHDFYRRDLTDTDGDEVSVFCCLHDGQPSLLYPFFDLPSGDLSPLQPMREQVDGDIIWIEPKAVASRQLSKGSDPTAEAQGLVDSVARGLGVLSEHLRRTGDAVEDRKEPGEAGSVPTNLTSWTDVLGYLRSSYTIAEEFNDDEADPSAVTSCKLIFDVGDGRTQVVFAVLMDLGGDPWVRITSPFAHLEAVNLLDVLQKASRTVCGDVRLLGDLVTLNHTAPVKGLDSTALKALVALIVSTADQLEAEFGAGDDF